MEDKILFEQAYSSHGKSFKRIQQTVSKTMSHSVWEKCSEQKEKSVEILRRVKLEVPFKILFHSLKKCLEKLWYSAFIYKLLKDYTITACCEVL